METPKPTNAARRMPSHALYMGEGLSSKKTAFIVVTVIGCIAILWPQVLYPMLFGGTAPKIDKGQRGQGGCCQVVLNREDFLNVTDVAKVRMPLYRKHLSLLTGVATLRQERPTHLHPESIYQAMRERGRAIPATPTVPIVDRKPSVSNPAPRIVEGRPGPIPGMRPPMGAGSVHQPQAKGNNNSMGILMPLYTIGIIVFFSYTILKIVFKKSIPNAPYGPAPANVDFRKDVFGKNGTDDDNSKIGWREHQTRSNLHLQSKNDSSELYNVSLSAANTATNLSSSLKQHHQHHHYLHQSSQEEQIHATVGKLLNKESEKLMEIEKLRKKLEDTEKAMAKLIAEMNSDQYDAKESVDESTNSNNTNSNTSDDHITEHKIEDTDGAIDKSQHSKDQMSKDLQHNNVDGNAERSVTVLGIEVTASCEGGKKWTGRPPTPVFLTHNEHSNENEIPKPQSIYLEGSVSHDAKILVSDSETKTEEIYDTELNGNSEEPAVVLSSKMTLSLINLAASEIYDNKNEVESPLADDIEIIGHDEN